MLLAKKNFLPHSWCKLARTNFLHPLRNKIAVSVKTNGRTRELAARGPFLPALASQWSRTLYFLFVPVTIFPVRSAVSHAEAHIPTQPSSPLEDARISYSHEDQERTSGDFQTPRQRTQARLGEARFPRVAASVCIWTHLHKFRS